MQRTIVTLCKTKRQLEFFNDLLPILVRKSQTPESDAEYAVGLLAGATPKSYLSFSPRLIGVRVLFWMNHEHTDLLLKQLLTFTLMTG